MKNLKSSVSNMGICNAQQQKDIVKRNNNGMPNIERMMPAASDKGSQPYRNAFRCFEPTVTVREARESKWLERNSPHKNIACPWVGDIV